ncbi:MAG: hypothetical protein AVDCRST_MAG16-2655, partial [uncultured Frankineae bacterium]
ARVRDLLRHGPDGHGGAGLQGAAGRRPARRGGAGLARLGCRSAADRRALVAGLRRRPAGRELRGVAGRRARVRPGRLAPARL